MWRRTSAGRIKVLVVHRPHYRDWSLPKGKLRRGEAGLKGALREVLEETGLRCKPGPEIAPARYIDRRGRKKRVRYWAMQAVAGAFEPNREVDRVRWVPMEDLPSVLSYLYDVSVVRSLEPVFEDARV